MRVRSWMGLGAALFWSLTAGAAAAAEASPLDVVPTLDLERYSGTWYEIARLPNRFQKHCSGDVTATYRIQDAGRLSVINTCRTEGGKTDAAKGVAKLADPNGPASRLKVRFAPVYLSWLPMVWGDYQVIALAPDYTHALVGTPDRKYLWILSRTPTIEEGVYGSLLRVAASQGFDVGQVVRTPQGP